MGDQGVLRSRVVSFAQCDLYEPAAHVLADVLGLDEADAKSLILGRQTWKMYKENNLKVERRWKASNCRFLRLVIFV